MSFGFGWRKASPTNAQSVIGFPLSLVSELMDGETIQVISSLCLHLINLDTSTLLEDENKFTNWTFCSSRWLVSGVRLSVMEITIIIDLGCEVLC